MTGAIFFGWGQIYAVFPALCTQVFGTSYCAMQAGLLFTAKGVVTLLMVLFGAVLMPTLEWRPAFYCAAALNAFAAVVALAVLRPVILNMRAQAGRPR
jgi:MFS transporter, OFA family, oxalate/formate antiporter